VPQYLRAPVGLFVIGRRPCSNLPPSARKFQHLRTHFSFWPPLGRFVNEGSSPPRSVRAVEPLGRLQAIPGVGRLEGLTVLTHLPELGTLDRKRITALAGLAPFACESGLQRGRRAIWGGRGDARAMLFLAAQSAARWNVPLRLFYERLVGRGKSKKAALAAVARKLLIAINAMMRDQRPWQPAIVAEPSCC